MQSANRKLGAALAPVISVKDEVSSLRVAYLPAFQPHPLRSTSTGTLVNDTIEIAEYLERASHGLRQASHSH